MYSREFSALPEKIIQNGKANFGAYEGVTKNLDIKGMRTPYAGIPLPTLISRLRIKSRLNYIFNMDNYIGIVTFFDFKIFGLAEIILWNKSTGKKYSYHATMPTRKRFVPQTTYRGICACYRRSRFLKISWGRKHQHHAVTFKTIKNSFHPAFEGYFYSPMEDSFHKDYLFVSPSPAQLRCSATWLASMSLHGHITMNEEQVEDGNGFGAMIMNRTYYKSHTKSTMAYTVGKNKEQSIMFNIKSSNLDAADAAKYNENILIVDGEPTTLPPVYITHSFGIAKNWIIQDTESMVDLTFTPISLDTRVYNIIAFRTEYSNIYGTFEGVLLTKDGNKITLKGFPGIIHTDLVRI